MTTTTPKAFDLVHKIIGITTGALAIAGKILFCFPISVMVMVAVYWGMFWVYRKLHWKFKAWESGNSEEVDLYKTLKKWHHLFNSVLLAVPLLCITMALAVRFVPSLTNCALASGFTSAEANNPTNLVLHVNFAMTATNSTMVGTNATVSLIGVPTVQDLKLLPSDIVIDSILRPFLTLCLKFSSGAGFVTMILIALIFTGEKIAAKRLASH